MLNFTRLTSFAVCLSAVCQSTLPVQAEFDVDEARRSIFRITATNPDGSRLECSGFKIAGREGVFTTLHGVAGANRIAATLYSSETPTYCEMAVKEADIDRDIAYLVPTAGQPKLPGEGLKAQIGIDLRDLGDASVWVVGFPMNIDLLASATKLQVRDRPIEKLELLLNPQAREQLALRKSPSISHEVLNLQGNLLPGHSGAPIFNSRGSVIAVGSGGLNEGRVGHSWAIPLQDVRARRVDGNAALESQLASLGKLSTNSNLFCVIDQQLRDGKKVVSVQTSTVIESDDGNPVRVHLVRPSDGVKKGLGLIGKVTADLIAGNEPISPQEAQKAMFEEVGIWVASGTSVRVLAIDGDSETGIAKPIEDPIGLGLKGLFEKTSSDADDGPPADPTAGAFDRLVSLVDQMNTEIEIVEGPHKGKKGWVHSSIVSRQSVFVERDE